MSLRLRITITTALLIFLAASVLAAIAYATAARIQTDAIDQALIGAAGQVSPRSLESNPPPLPPDVYQSFAVALVRPGSDTADLLLPAGFGEQPIDFPAVSRGQATDLVDSITTIEGPPAYRLYVRRSGPEDGLLIVGTPVDDVRAGLNQLAVGLLASVVAVTAVGALVSWIVVRRFFAPVDEMVAAAGRIADGDVDMRVPSAASGTELGELAEALNRMIESLTASLHIVGESEVRLRSFVSDASHEIRTPLTVIRGYVELLQANRTDASEMERRALDRIASESARLEGLVTQLLLLDRIDRTDDDVEFFDLSALVREYLEDLADLDDRHITWRLQPAMIHGSTDLWRQALANVAQNLQRHTPPGSPVDVTVAASEGRVTLDVDDAGPGIPPSRRAAAVDRFTRIDDVRSSTAGGFGLGMSVIDAVVRRHHGTLELLDSPLGGLRLRITVPA